MEFWVYMLLIDLLIPALMIAFGRYFMFTPPAEINNVFGYRTHMSKLNCDTWAFAHYCIGRLWFIIGLVMLPLSIAAMLFILGGSEETVSAFGIIVCVVQLVPMCVPIGVTEYTLRCVFDENGNRRMNK